MKVCSQGRTCENCQVSVKWGVPGDQLWVGTRGNLPEERGPRNFVVKITWETRKFCKDVATHV